MQDNIIGYKKFNLPLYTLTYLSTPEGPLPNGYQILRYFFLFAGTVQKGPTVQIIGKKKYRIRNFV